MGIEIHHITRTFGEFTALQDVSLKVHHGELVALLGPSGSGKTTLLRIIAGLEQPDPGSGPVLFSNESSPDGMTAAKNATPGEKSTWRRETKRNGASVGNVGFVFQHYALFRHMSVFENVAFGLRVRPRRERPSNDEIHERVMRLLRMVQLESFAQRQPNQLSGGQRQRVALARALAIEPRVLLLDEPFGALDAKVRRELRTWLWELHKKMQFTCVFVTHDQEEALELAGRVVVMNQGRIEQTGTPDEVFHSPRTEFVTTFLGQVNLFGGRISDGKLHFSPGPGDRSTPETGDRQVRVFIRPHDLDLFTSQESLRNAEPVAISGNAGFDGVTVPDGIRARVLRVHTAGPSARIDLTAEGGEHVIVEMSQDRFDRCCVESGSEVYVRPRQVRVFQNDSGNGDVHDAPPVATDETIHDDTRKNFPATISLRHRA